LKKAEPKPRVSPSFPGILLFVSDTLDYPFSIRGEQERIVPRLPIIENKIPVTLFFNQVILHQMEIGFS
jgi:hypothetical protein